MTSRTAFQRYNFLTNHAKDWHCPPGQRVLARRYKRIGNTLYKQLYQDEVGSKLPDHLSDAFLLEMTFFKSIDHLSKMRKRKEFYKSHATLFLRYMNILVKRNHDDDIDGPIRQMLFNSAYLLDEYRVHIKGEDKKFGVWKSEMSDGFRVFSDFSRLLEEMPVNDVNSATAVLRTSIECRIRSAFGVYGAYDTERKAAIIVDFSQILEAMKSEENNFFCAVPVSDIKRIYQWTNVYIHLVFTTYPWMVFFAKDLLWPLFKHHRCPDGSMDLFASIMIKKSVVERIQSNIRDICGMPSSAVFFGAAPGEGRVVMLPE